METLDRLFDRLSIIAELVFFLDGPVVGTKFETWASRQNRKYHTHSKVLDMVYQELPLSTIAATSSIYSNISLNVIEESCKKFGKFYYSVTSECDQEVAKFCYGNQRVLAVFSIDTDYLIFPGHWRLFSTKCLNFDKLTTKEFNRRLLRDDLGLTNFQMTVFATIAGNDIVRYQELTQFHSRFSHNPGVKLPALANLVRAITKNSRNRRKLLENLSINICGDSNKISMDTLNASINSYNVLSEESSPSCEDSQWSFLLYQHHLFTYSIINRLPINFSLVFFDLRWHDMPSYIDLCGPMFQRQAGIVHLLASLPSSELTIYSKTSHQQQYQKTNVRPTFPPFEVPSLLELYSDDKSFDDLRINLLKWCVSWIKFKDSNLLAIPPNHMTSILTLKFMIFECVIQKREAEIFLWTIKNADNGTIPVGLKPPKVLNARAFRLAFLFVRLYPNIDRCIEVCGLKNRYSVSSYQSIEKTT